METKKIFAHPHTLFGKVEEILTEVGPERFFKSSDQKVKKAQEGFAAYFFTLAMKKHTKKDWWLYQPDQAERSYPDFDFINFGNTPEDIGFESVELTTVPPHFKSFDEMMKIVGNKQKKYGKESVNFSLLIFVNHEKSEEWISLLKESLVNEQPFISIWTIHLMFKKGEQEIGSVVAQRVKPLPELRITVDMDDPDTHKIQPLPDYIDERYENGKHYIFLKKEFVNKINSFQVDKSNE